MLKSTIRDLRGLLERERVLSVAVLAGNVPYAGLLPFAPLADCSGVLVRASRLARHSQGLGADAIVTALVHESDGPEKDPLQLQRVSFECRVRPLERGSAEWQSGRESYLARFPGGAITFGMADFTLYRLEFRSAVYVAGFGRAMDLDAADIARLAERPA
jgi:putative heme iron utilization protein